MQFFSSRRLPRKYHTFINLLPSRLGYGKIPAVTVTIMLILAVLHISLLALIPSKGEETEPSTQSGHLKAFGKGNPSQHVEILEERITAKKFFTDYVNGKKAVLLKGTVSHSPAVTDWSDKYFLNLKLSKEEDEDILVENKKKESRLSPPSYMRFQSFVEIYNHTDQYMVNTVPSFLR